MTGHLLPKSPLAPLCQRGEFLPALAVHLDSIAKETERPRSYIIQRVLESYIEDYADLQVALDRLHDKTDPVISRKELGYR